MFPDYTSLVLYSIIRMVDNTTTGDLPAVTLLALQKEWSPVAGDPSTPQGQDFFQKRLLPCILHCVRGLEDQIGRKLALTTRSATREYKSMAAWVQALKVIVGACLPDGTEIDPLLLEQWARHELNKRVAACVKATSCWFRVIDFERAGLAGREALTARHAEAMIVLEKQVRLVAKALPARTASGLGREEKNGGETSRGNDKTTRTSSPNDPPEQSSAHGKIAIEFHPLPLAFALTTELHIRRNRIAQDTLQAIKQVLPIQAENCPVNDDGYAIDALSVMQWLVTLFYPAATQPAFELAKKTITDLIKGWDFLLNPDSGGRLLTRLREEVERMGWMTVRFKNEQESKDDAQKAAAAAANPSLSDPNTSTREYLVRHMFECFCSAVSRAKTRHEGKLLDGNTGVENFYTTTLTSLMVLQSKLHGGSPPKNLELYNAMRAAANEMQAASKAHQDLQDLAAALKNDITDDSSSIITTTTTTGQKRTPPGSPEAPAPKKTRGDGEGEVQADLVSQLSNLVEQTQAEMTAIKSMLASSTPATTQQPTELDAPEPRGVCWQWEDEGKCRFGDNCRFRHAGMEGEGTGSDDSDDSGSEEESPNVCIPFLYGTCKEGANCSKPHNEMLLEKLAPYLAP